VSALTLAQYNKAIPLEEKQRMVAHELGHFYQAKRFLGVNLDVTFGYHYAEPDDPVSTRVLIKTPDGKAIVQSRTHGESFIQRLDELVSCRSLDSYMAMKYRGYRLLGGGEMEKSLYGGESQGDSDDVHLLHSQLSQAWWMSDSDKQALEDAIRSEVRQSLTPDVLQMVRCAVSVLAAEHFNGKRTSGDVIHEILKGCQHDSGTRTENRSDNQRSGI
jgi:hypothetical protein